MNDSSDIPVVAIDGPSGAGKGTVARRVAARLGFNFLDSGAVYRAAALHCLRQDADLDNAALVVSAISSMQLDFNPGDHFNPGDPEADRNGENNAPNGVADIRVLLDSRDVTRELRSEETADAASRIAVMPDVRKPLLQVQRDFRVQPGLVADGRDMGTVVFQQALVKIFLTASARVRAERRQKQLKEQGMEAKLAGLMQEIERRDQRDSSRKHAPLVAAGDAITIDTSDLSIEQATGIVLQKVNARLVKSAVASC